MTLLDKILTSAESHPSSQQVCYAVSQGLLEIITKSTCCGKPKAQDEEDKWTVYMQMESVHVGTLLTQSTQFLLNYLNLGNFEGASGASQIVVQRLNLIKHMLFIALHATDKQGKQSIQAFFEHVETTKCTH